MLYYKPTIRRSDMQSVLMSMADEDIGVGKRCEEFKSILKKYMNYKNITLLRSPLIAFFLALEILNIQPGDKVIIPCFFPFYYAQILYDNNIECIICDVDTDTALIDVSKLDNLKNVKAIFISSHLAHVPKLSQFKKMGIKTVCDLSECIGCDVDVSDIDIALLSLEDDKVITSGGGSCLLTNNYKIPSPLHQELLCDLNVSLSLMQLKSFDFYLKKRVEIRKRFVRAAEMSNKRIFSFYDDEKVDNAFRFAILLKNVKDCLNFLDKHKIPVRKTFEKTVYENLKNKDKFLNASYLYAHVYSFPFYYFLKNSEIELICKVLSSLP